MRLPLLIHALGLLSALAVSSAQEPRPAFEVASARPSQNEVGPDYNNQITVSATEFNGHNVTLKRLIAEAWQCQLKQVVGPAWLDHNEYDVVARIPTGANKQQIPLMLRSLLSDRFHLKEHSQTRQMRVYELEVGEGGPKIQPISAAKRPTETSALSGFHFHGDMRSFADLLAVQFSMPAMQDPTAPVRAGGDPIPVLDNTGLQGVYDFSVPMRPELGTDAFTAWKRVLPDLGLKIESRKGDVPVVVVDDVSKMPTSN